MPFQRWWKCIFHWHGQAWLTIWDRVKIPRYSHRLMHRKRVTSELHDSYFHSMTIKHAIPKTAEVTHSDGQLWRDTEWAIELLYNSVKIGSQLVWRPDQLVTRYSRESQHPAEGGSGPPIEELETRYGRESQHPAEGASGPPIRVWRLESFWRPDQFWRPESLKTRCGRERSQHPAESWAPKPPVEQPWRMGKKR